MGARGTGACALLDTTATGAVLAGHDFSQGSRLVTISLSVQFLAAAPSEDLIATGQCTRRGNRVHFAEAYATGATSGTVVATGQVAASISGERPGTPWHQPGQRIARRRPRVRSSQAS